MLRCTWPKCRAVIRAWTGLDEVLKVRKHFAKAHKIDLYTDEAAEIRAAMEDGKEPRPELVGILLKRAYPNSIRD